MIRSREIPSGTEGGRKQPTVTPWASAAAWAASATCGDGIGTDSTAPADGRDAERGGEVGHPAAYDVGELGPGAQLPQRLQRGAGRGGREPGVEDERAGPG